MNELTVFLLKLSATIGFMLFIVLMSRPFDSFECKHNEDFSNYIINGIVTGKEKDSFYNGSERVTTKNKNGLFRWEERSFESRNKPFYNKIAIGDSIVKEDGQLTLQIFKEDTTIIIDLSFDCK